MGLSMESKILYSQTSVCFQVWTPTFIESEKGLAILGTPGGARIITMVLLSILLIILKAALLRL